MNDEIMFKLFVGIMVLLFLAVFIGIVSVPFIAYTNAKTECQLYNEKFGTHYKTSQFFFAGETIKSYLNQGEQKTFNIKGEIK